MSTGSHDDKPDLFELGLQAFREDTGTEAQRRELERRLVDLLGADALDAPVVATGHGAASPSTMAPWNAVVGGVLVAGLMLYSANDSWSSKAVRSERAAAREESATPRQAPTSTTAPAPVALSPAIVQAPPMVEIKASGSARAQERSRQPSAPLSPAPAVVVAPLEDELTLLQRARAAMHKDAGAALLIVEQHARDYPRGVFAQEREVIAVNALLKQRRPVDAFQRAEQFLATHEGSAYAVQLRAMLANKPRATTPSEHEPKGAEP